MSSYYKHNSENKTHTLDIQSKVKLTDLLSRINEEKKIERKNKVLDLSEVAISPKNNQLH